MARKRPDWSSIIYVPQSDGVVCRAGRKGVIIGSEGQRIDPIAVPFERAVQPVAELALNLEGCEATFQIVSSPPWGVGRGG